MPRHGVVPLVAVDEVIVGGKPVVELDHRGRWRSGNRLHWIGRGGAGHRAILAPHGDLAAHRDGKACAAPSLCMPPSGWTTWAVAERTAILRDPCQKPRRTALRFAGRRILD